MIKTRIVSVVISFVVLFQYEAASRMLPETMDIGGWAVPQFVEQAMKKVDKAWYAQQDFVYQPEQSAAQLKAQMALSVWFSEHYFNAVARQRFIFNSLRDACSIPSQPTLLAPNGTRHGPLSILHEYALTYRLSLEEIDNWWLNVGSKTRREIWAHHHVERWLRTSSDDQRRPGALMRITRNLDPVTDRGIDAFESWWTEAKNHDRNHWVFLLIDRALDRLNPDSDDAVGSYGIEKDQLRVLLPQTICIKYGITLSSEADEEDKRLYTDEPLDVDTFESLKQWWLDHREGYRIPNDSPFREPDSQPWNSRD